MIQIVTLSLTATLLSELYARTSPLPSPRGTPLFQEQIYWSENVLRAFVADLV